MKANKTQAQIKLTVSGRINFTKSKYIRDVMKLEVNKHHKRFLNKSHIHRVSLRNPVSFKFGLSLCTMMIIVMWNLIPCVKSSYQWHQPSSSYTPDHSRV